VQGANRRGRATTGCVAAALAGACIAMTAGPALAVSEVYCYPNTGIDPSCADGSTNLQAVLNMASEDMPELDHDTVLLGPGNHTVPGNQGYNEGADPGNTVEIRGAGVGVTVLTLQDTTGSRHALGFSAAAGSTLSDLSIVVTAADDGTQDQGLNLGGESLTRDVSVSGPDATNVTGAFMGGSAVLDDSVIDLGVDNAPANTAIRENGGSPLVTDSTLTADLGITHIGSGFTTTVERSTVNASDVGIGGDAGSFVLRNSVVDLDNRPAAVGVQAANFNEGTNTMNATVEGSTIVNGGANSIGVEAIGDSSNDGEDATATVRNTAIDDVATPVFVGADDADMATVTTEHSNYDASAVVDDDNLDDAGPTGITSLTQTSQTDHAPGFVGPALGDYHLLATSPLIDIGDPAAPTAGSLDLDGQPRALPGSPSCPDVSGRRDIGADEFAAQVLDCQAPDTTVSGKGKVRSKKKRVKLRFTLGSNEPGSTFECSLDGSAFAPCTSPYATKAKRGKHDLTVRATDPSGNKDATPAKHKFRVTKAKRKRK
jgi:hypothetical protein